MAAYRPATRGPEPVAMVQRSAIYTRKSTSAGLEQEFNKIGRAHV